MPWHVEKSESKCSASKPWAVVKDSDGSTVGCHATKSAANKQLAALNAAEPQASKGDDMGEETNASREAGAGALENGNPPRDNLIRAISPGAELVRAEGEDEQPTMTGHFAVFNEWTEINSIFEGNFMERFAPGAFSKTFQENRDRMRVLFQHGFDPVLGDKPLGPIRALEEDKRGARYEVELLDAPYVRDNVLPGLEAGLYGASFRFKVLKEEFETKPRRSQRNPEGLPERTVTEAQVREFGPVTFPAYAGATAGIRSLTDEFMFGRFIDDPDRLRELIEATTKTRAVEPERSDATTPPEEPEPSAAATPPAPETREVIRVPAEKKETKTMTVDERRARVEEIKARRQEIHAEYGADKLPDEIQREWDELTAERHEHLEAISSYEDRTRQIEEDARDDRRVESEEKQTRSFYSNTSTRKRTPDNPFAVEEYRALANSVDDLPELYREGAKRAVDGAVFPHERADEGKTQKHIERLLEHADKGKGALAQRILITGSPVYQRAFGKHLLGKSLNAEEQRALSVAGEGGQAVPYTLDPTIIPTSNGSVNPLRAISRVETITGNEWRGVSSAGITAAYAAEATEASDNAPDLSQPTANVEKAQAFIPYSIEIGEDWGSLQSEMARLLQDSKDDLEATEFVTGVGHGSSKPEGLLVGGTAVVSTAAATALAVADLYSLEEALPPRFVPRARIVANKKQFNRVRQFDTSGGAALWVRLGDGLPPELIGYSAHELSTMSSALTSGASIITIGDFSHFLIVDRVGMNVEVIPHLFATGANRPSGQRGLYAYWRNTSEVLAWQAFRTLKVT